MRRPKSVRSANRPLSAASIPASSKASAFPAAVSAASRATSCISSCGTTAFPTDALESGKRKILVVDDDEELVELIIDVLDKDGRFEVRSVNNGFDAGMMVKEYHPDLIVLDVMLPDINGKEVCQRVRSDPTMDDVKIICISGMVEQDKIDDLKAAGANDFLQKPFEVDQLVDRICQHLEVET